MTTRAIFYDVSCLLFLYFIFDYVLYVYESAYCRQANTVLPVYYIAVVTNIR